MKIINSILIVAMVVSFGGLSFAADADDDDSGNNAGNSALGGAVLGGLLGAGLGAGIGSASGHAGTGALIGGGAGALGGALIGASQADKGKSKHDKYVPVEESSKIPKDAKVKKRVVREYDEAGNIISEKEVAN